MLSSLCPSTPLFSLSLSLSLSLSRCVYDRGWVQWGRMKTQRNSSLIILVNLNPLILLQVANMARWCEPPHSLCVCVCVCVCLCVRVYDSEGGREGGREGTRVWERSGGAREEKYREKVAAARISLTDTTGASTSASHACHRHSHPGPRASGLRPSSFFSSQLKPGTRSPKPESPKPKVRTLDPSPPRG